MDTALVELGKGICSCQLEQRYVFINAFIIKHTVCHNR